MKDYNGDPNSSAWTWINNGPVDKHLLEGNGLVEGNEALWCPVECLLALCSNLVER